MVGVNKCLKGLFYGVNILLTMVAGLIAAFIILMNVYAQSDSQDQAPLWLRVTGICAVATLGIYGASKDKKWPLIVYITANAIGVIMFLTQGALFVKERTLVSSYSMPGKLSGMLSDKLPGTLSGKLSGMLSDKLPGTLSGKLSDMLSDKLPGTLSGTLSRSLLQGMTLVADCTLAINFVPAALGFTGIILAAMIMHQLHSRQPAMTDVEGEPPEHSQMCPMSSK